ncbi:uncharacterized protein LOC135820067 [Sycon ciliatum]|uniref:uncharacterized protein LOC135820067 n=1 Tax=Sycon ciliatum TaxID=27933 RepID=UPI0031F6DA03
MSSIKAFARQVSRSNLTIDNPELSSYRSVILASVANESYEQLSLKLLPMSDEVAKLELDSAAIPHKQFNTGFGVVGGVGASGVAGGGADGAGRSWGGGGADGAGGGGGYGAGGPGGGPGGGAGGGGAGDAGGGGGGDAGGGDGAGCDGGDN